MTTTATVTSGTSWTVPAGITKVDVVAYGRPGPAGSKVGPGTPGAGGRGAKVTKRGVTVSGTVAIDLGRVSVGSFLYAGCGGQGGDSGDYNGGAGGSIDPATGNGFAGSPSGGGSLGGGGAVGATQGTDRTPTSAGGVSGGAGGGGYARGGYGQVNTGSKGGGGGGAGSSYGYDEISVSVNANPSVEFTYASAPFVPTNLAANSGGNVLVEAATTLTWSHMPATADTLDGQAAYQVRYRVIGAGSWTELAKVTSATSSATIAANTFTADDFEWQVKTFADRLAGPYSDSAYFTAQASILAPTNLSPDNGDTVDISDPLTISWLHNTIGGAPQTGYDLRYDTVPTSGAWTTVSDHATATMSKVFASATFSAANYKYQVCTYISGGGPGPWSAEATFAGVNNVPAPVITAPASLDVVTDLTFPLTWTFTDQQAYEVQMLPDVAGTPDTAHPYSAGQVASVAQSLTLTAPADGVTVWLRIRCQDSSDVWSPWAQVKVSVAWASPATPTFQVGYLAESGGMTVAIANPAPTGDQPDITENWVYITESGVEQRRAIVDEGGTWTYYVPPSGTDVGIRVVAVAAGTGKTATTAVEY